jgi:predicted TIM-barrel fold metal-dependent hydrolase
VATETTTGTSTPQPVAAGLVDCDIHNTPASTAAFKPFLSERWRRHLERYGGRQRHAFATGFPFPKSAPLAARVDAWPPGGGPPGSDLAFMREQHLDPLGVRFGILNCLHPGANEMDVELGAALATAVNDWQVAEWLEPEPRLRASMVLPFEDGELAAAEIVRRAGDSRFVQALMVVRTMEPMGRRRYWPIYAAAQEAGVTIGVHFGGYGGNAITGSGWPSYYFEDHTLMAQSFQAQLVSLVFEGVFERFPRLRVVLIEGGIAWVPPMLWRMDRIFGRMHDEVPELKRRPSEYVRDHVWFTTQPIEEPERPTDLLRTVEHMDAPGHLVFATDYPHWDFDSPSRAIPVAFPPQLRERIFSTNALALYRLPA